MLAFVSFASEVLNNFPWMVSRSAGRNCPPLGSASSVCKGRDESGHGGKKMGPLGAIVPPWSVCLRTCNGRKKIIPFWLSDGSQVFLFRAASCSPD